jgi:hypothetical protein
LKQDGGHEPNASSSWRRFDTFFKGLQAEEVKVAKCVELKFFALQVQIVQALNRRVDAQRGVVETFKSFTCKGKSAFFEVHKDEADASGILVNLSNYVKISRQHEFAIKDLISQCKEDFF